MAGNQEYAGGWRIRLIAFVCGAGVMGLEMAGVRLLEPYLGSTIYVWGAIIGIFLGALALGYFLGGRLADYSPHLKTLGIIIALAAVWIFAIPPAAVRAGPGIAQGVSDPRLAAFFCSLLLYAVPSLLLGMVSPFAVRLAARDVNSLGNVAGSLYAISTGGSIIGTFLVTFVLTELIGTMSITWGVGAALLLTAGLCVKMRAGAKTAALVLTGAVLLGAGWTGSADADLRREIRSVFPASSASSRAIENGVQLAMRESAYHLINVFDSDYNLDTQNFLGKGTKARYMVFNEQIESGCLVDASANGEAKPTEPVRTACGYVRMLSLGALVSGKTPERMVIIGGGGGVGAKLMRQDYPATLKRVDVVDIDRHVFELAGRYFGYPYPESDGTIYSHVRDGRLFLKDGQEGWDYIVLDAYTAGGRIPRHLITQEFFRLAQSKLAPEGVVVCNIISAVDGDKGRLLRAVCRTMESVFGQVYAFPRIGDPTRASNVFLVGTDRKGPRLTPGQLIERFQEGKLVRQPVGKALYNQLFASPATASDPVLTDDFCPTDSMGR